MNERTTDGRAEPLPALTGVRLPLALWVVIHHLSGPGRLLDSVIAPHRQTAAFIDAAWVALSAFFAISGFLLARRYTAISWNRRDLAQFATARFARIYPVYALSLAILVPIMHESLTGSDLGNPMERIGIAANYLLLLQGWHRPPVDWNTPAWSLSCEVFFYASAPIVVGLVRRPSTPRLLAAIALACAIPISLRLLLEPPIPKALLYFGDFLIGVAAAGLFARIGNGRVARSRVGPWLYLPALVIGSVWVIRRDDFASFLVFDTGVRLISMVLVLGLACGGGRLVTLLSTPIAQAGGRSSYAVYILHVPLLWWFERSAIHTTLSPLPGAVFYLVAVLAVSMATSRWYEEPMNGLIRRWREASWLPHARQREWAAAAPDAETPVRRDLDPCRGRAQ